MTDLPFHEQSVLDRLEENHNPLGWAPWKRDEDGVAMLKCDQPVSETEVRRSVVKLTVKGMVYLDPYVCNVDS